MKDLVPAWAEHYGEFWRAIRVRNLWFIRLRYLVVLILIGFIFVGEYILYLNFTRQQLIAISIITLSILLYNIVIHASRKFVGATSGSFNALHISLIQMILDLTALMFLVYFTGLIESPLYMFFIFHMIIGSLILPGYIVYIAAGVVSCSFAVLTFFQRYNYLESHPISGLFLGNRPHTLTYDILFVSIFAIMLFISVHIANKIAHQLYKREQQLRSSLKRVNEAEITKQKYTIGIVHEIKTPITAVHSILELIKNGYVGPISDTVAQKIERAELRTEEAIQLIKNILNISQVRLLEIQLKDQIDLNEFITFIIDTFSETVNQKSIQLVFTDKRKAVKLLRSDKILLELVISNVVANAIKYVDTNSSIEIIIDDRDDKFYLEVCDSGIGIPRKEIDKVFNQFYRASNINKMIHEGSGMGLAIVKEIVEKLGGEIKVTSPSRLAKEGKPGTSFEILIPYRYKPGVYDIFEVNDEEYLNSKNNF